MNSTEYVSTRLESLIQMGASKPEIVRQMAIACDGWPYVFGAWGEQCTPANRRRRKRDDHPTIVTACQVLNGDRASCSGCRWDLPVDMFDCRGYTYWCLKQAGIIIDGQGATSQWSATANWVLRGEIKDLPKNKVCCLFVKKGDKMSHTGLYLGDGTTAECSSNVQLKKSVASKWTHFAIPAGLYDGGDVPVPSGKPMLRKGDSGAYVALMQSELIQRGYSCGSTGADGKFGSNTEKAVRAFQSANGLKVDGICGDKTWEALDSAEVPLYTACVPHLTKAQAEQIINQYAGAYMTPE